ncbi:hypothetical protein [Kitasatospora sp. MY 5-36]|uniref:hypothetical protein n=1 Tax=Kitasatospora sp. MY 5-36 TaxID=1678027 RepID=UPI0007C85CD0|nr:hypothetical protein [Kitasatospora sp. MY 5-36]
MAKRLSRLLVGGAVAVAATLGATALASADGTPADNSAAPVAIEDFNYPGPAPYPNVKLLRGDGHIVLSDCAVDSQISVFSFDLPNAGGNQICFRATSTTGYLALEVPNVFRIRTDAYSLNAKLTSVDGAQSVDIAKGTALPVGIGSGSGNGKPAALLELRVTG